MNWGARNFRKSIGGATLIEFSLILPLLLMITFGTAEFGYVLYQFNSAQKATQAGARVASSRTVLTNVLECFVENNGGGNGNNTDPEPAGTNCASVTGALDWNGVTCVHPDDNTGNTTNCDDFGIRAVYTEMQAFYPNLTTTGYEVEFGPTGLGYIGRGAPVPSITVRIKDMNYNYIAIGGIVRFFDNNSDFGNSIAIASAETTVVGEDMDEGT